MDDSQAKGLAKRFIREYIEELDRVTAIFTKRKGRKRNLFKDLFKFTTQNKHLFLSLQIVGSKRQPMLFFSMLDKGDYNPSQHFDELNLFDVYFYHIPRYELTALSDRPKFLLSHHCIQRLFQRLYRGPYLFKKASRIITEELALVCVWSAIWELLWKYVYQTINFHPEVSIPTPNGLLLCTRSEEAGIDIRTYIDKELFTEEQKELHACMLQVSKGITCIPFGYHEIWQHEAILNDLSEPCLRALISLIYPLRVELLYSLAGNKNRLAARNSINEFENYFGDADLGDFLREIIREGGFNNYYREHHRQALQNVTQ